ncbi:hypothetical protein MTR_3g062230 [Medicago truncatula]|uniref:Disease resistance protein At4g27190-like leucine-rich repeats domain-containing protein n=1 Tax=Medicago truncatula TaxID=3880 RepID=G7IV26_MEDTR|nr:hypothetical protein MTR_3g062230 [Medicago truncatula]
MNISKMKSVFILSIAPRMLLETLTISKCDELKHIIIDTGYHNTGGNNWGTVFPNLRSVEVGDCEQLEYIIGQYTDDHQNHTEIHLRLPALECLSLWNLPSLVGMSRKQYQTTFPPLEELELIECSQFANIKSIGDFITHHSVIRSVDDRIIEELSGNVDHFLALKKLVVYNNSEVESIVCLNEINEQKMNLALKVIDLDVLPMMTCLFVGPKISISLQNLKELRIMRCEKLKIIFSTCIIRCLPQLHYIRVEECKELKHIIEDDLENKKSSNFMSTKTCFQKLKTLVVAKCNKLKYVFPISVYKELPELNYLIIREADELEEIFVSEGDDHKVEIPYLRFVVFENLPSLCHAQGIQFEAVTYRFIQNCQKLSLASATTAILESDLYGLDINIYDWELKDYLRALFRQLQKETKGHNNGNENPENSKGFAAGVEVKASSEHKLTSPKKTKETPKTEHELVENVPDLEIPTNSKELMNEQTMDQQRLVGETDTAVKPFQVSEISVEEGTTSANAKRTTASSQCLKETENQSIQGGPTSETRNEPSIQLVSDLDGSQETTQTNDNQDFDLYLHMESVYRQFQAKSKGHENGNENPNAQTTKEFAAWVEAEAASRHAFTSLKLEGSTSENTAAATLSTISGTKNELPIQLDVAPKQKGMKISFEEGTTSTYDKTITSSTHSVRLSPTYSIQQGSSQYIFI